MNTTGAHVTLIAEKSSTKLNIIKMNSSSINHFNFYGIFFNLFIHRFIPRNYDGTDYKNFIYSGLIEVFFKAPSFFPFLLQQQLTTLDFVSYCGGSLGLFLGFSAVSAIEIVYYLSLRIICFKRQSNKISSSDQNNEAVKTKNYLVEFVENSSIHGCNQIVMNRRHWIERILWFCIVLSAVFFCGSTTHNSLMKYLDAPVMIKHGDSIDSLEEITFPAITFSNELFMDYGRSVFMYNLQRIYLRYETVMSMFGEG
jgi:hypothetical protein